MDPQTMRAAAETAAKADQAHWITIAFFVVLFGGMAIQIGVAIWKAHSKAKARALVLAEKNMRAAKAVGAKKADGIPLPSDVPRNARV